MIDEHDDEEGARSFSRTIAVIADGQLNGDASEELHKLIRDLKAESALRHAPVKGTITLEMTFNVEPHGYVEVTPKIKTKMAERRRPKGVMWITPGGNLSEKNPRQQDLPLQDVGGRGEARDVVVGRREVKEV